MERGSLPWDLASLDTAAPAGLGRPTPASSPRCRQGRLRWSQHPEYHTHNFGCREKGGKADTTCSLVTLCGREKGSPVAVPAPTWAGDPSWLLPPPKAGAGRWGGIRVPAEHPEHPPGGWRSSTVGSPTRSSPLSLPGRGTTQKCFFLGFFWFF